MAPASNRNDPERRLRFLRLGLIFIVAMAFAVGAGVTYSVLRDMGTALGQGLLWGIGTAVVVLIFYLAYQKVVVKK